MANDENLIPMSERSKSEVREIGRKGGIASGKVRSARAREREEWSRLLSMAMNSGECNDIDSLADAKKANLSISTAMKIKLITEALKGNIKAYETIYRYAGAEDPEPQEESKGNANSFIEALNNTAAEVWSSEAEDAKEE